MNARGRNGDFQVAHIEVGFVRFSASIGEISIALYSKSKAALDAPVRIFATRAEAISLCKKILAHCDLTKPEELTTLLNETLVMLKLSGKE